MVNTNFLIEALEKFKETKLNPEDLRKNAEKFSKERFKKEMLDLVARHSKKHHSASIS